MFIMDKKQIKYILELIEKYILKDKLEMLGIEGYNIAYISNEDWKQFKKELMEELS